MGRAPCCDKAKVKKGPWSPEEDAKLKSHIQNHGTGGNWIALPTKIEMRKELRLRWLNYLRPNLKHGGFTENEDNLICNLYVTIGSRWSVIAAQLPGRTDNDIKNYWNTRLKKKLLGKQRRSSPAANIPPLPLPPFDHAQPHHNVWENYSPIIHFPSISMENVISWEQMNYQPWMLFDEPSLLPTLSPSLPWPSLLQQQI